MIKPRLAYMFGLILVLLLPSIPLSADNNRSLVIKSASELDYPPFSVVGENNEAAGFSVDLLKATLTAMDKNVSFKVDSWSTIKKELAEGAIDVLPVVGRTPEREKVYDFTFPYMTMHGGILVREKNSSIKTLGDLANAEVMVMEGDNAHEFVIRDKVSSNIVATKSYEEAIKALAEGKGDAVIVQRLVGLQLLKRLEIDNLKFVGKPIEGFKQSFCFAVTKGNTELLATLNEGLSIVISNGTFEQLQKDWFSQYDKAEGYNNFLLALLSSIVTLIIVGGIAYLSQAYLRNEVLARTKDLQATNEALSEQQRVLEKQADRLKQANEETERKAQALEEASKYKSQFLANMSHELRTPLNSMLILSSDLAKNAANNLTKEQIEAAQIINEGGVELNELISDIMDLSKVEAGMLRIYNEQVRLSDISLAMQKSFEPVAASKSIGFSITINDDVPDFIVSDGRRIEQVLRNFLSNAFKFTKSGSVSLSISLLTDNTAVSSSHLTEGSVVAFEVKDTGIGISKEKQNAIFEAFQQEDGSTSRKYGGTGLGLTISKSLTTLLQGEICLSSETNHGSCFTLYLPMRPTDGVIDSVGQSTIRDDSQQLIDRTCDMATPVDMAVDTELEGQRVLLVDDDIRNVFALSGVLTKLGMVTTIANDGEHALEKLDSKPDVILMDIMMPTMDGFEATREIRSRGEFKDTPIIALTAQAMTGDREKCIDAGASEYMTKPINVDQLVVKLKESLNVNSSHRPNG